MNVCFSSTAPPPQSNSYAQATSSTSSSGPRMRTVGVAEGSAQSITHAAVVPDSSAAAYGLVNTGSLGGFNGTRKLADSGLDVFHVLLVVVCMLLVVTVVLLIAVLRLLKRVAAAAAAAEGSRLQDILSDELGAEEGTSHISLSVGNDEEEAALLGGNRYSSTQVEEDASLQQPLLHRVCGRGARAGRHARDSSRRQQQPGRRTSSSAFDAPRAPVGVSTTDPTSGESSDAEMATPQSGWRRHRAGCSAMPTPGSRAAARKCDKVAVAMASPSLALAAADHGGIRHGVDVLVPVFTATTEKDMVVYNTTHDSRYRILQRIGTGAFSSVYLVQEKTSGRELALKYILCKDDRERRAALRECEVIHCLQGHPQVIRIVDMFMNYQFRSPPEPPTVAGYPTASTATPRRREQAVGDQSSRPLPGVQTRAPAAIAPAVSPNAIHHAGMSRSLSERPSEVETRTESFPLTQLPGAVLSCRRVFAAAPVSTTASWAAARLNALKTAEMMRVADSTGLEEAVVTAALRACAGGQAMDSSTEYRAAVQDKDDDVNCSCVDTVAGGQRESNSTLLAVSQQYHSPHIATGLGYGSGDSGEDGAGCQRGSRCLHSLVGGVAHGAHTTSAIHVSGMEAGECILSNHLAAVDAGNFEVHQQPQPEGKQSMRASSLHYAHPFQHRVQHARQGRSSAHLRLAAAVKTSTTPIPASCPAEFAGSAYAPVPLLAAAGGGVRGYKHATWQPVPQTSTAPLTTASGAPAAASEVSPPTGGKVYPGETPMYCHTAVVPGAVVDNESDSAATAFASVGCCTTDGMTTTATTTHHCRPSTTRNTTGSPSSGASHERGTLEDYDDVEDLHSSKDSWRGKKQHTDLRADAGAGETRSGGSNDARYSVTTSSGTQEEPTQPIHRILALPLNMHPPGDSMDAAPGSRCICGNIASSMVSGVSSDAVPQLQNCTYAPDEGIPTAPNPSSSSPIFRAGGAPAAVGPVAVNDSAASLPAGRATEREAGGSLSSTASPPPRVNASAPALSLPSSPSAAAIVRGMASSIVHTAATPSPQQQQLPTCIFSVPQLQPKQEYSQPVPSMAALYVTPRPAVPSVDVTGAAAGTVAAGAPIRYSDFVPSPTTSVARATALWAPATATQANGEETTSDVKDGQAHRHSTGSGATVVRASGLALDRQISVSVNPYLKRALGGEPVPPPRTSYAPGGGMRYNSLILPYVAAPQTATNGLRIQLGSASSLFTTIARGTGASAFGARKASEGHESRFEVTDADSSSKDACASAPASHTTSFASPQPLSSTVPAAATVVRNTYAPLRYGNVLQSGAASLATSSMACSSVVPSSPPQQQQIPPQSSSAASPVASPTLSSDPLSMHEVIQGPRVGNRGQRTDQGNGKPHVGVPLESTDQALTPTQAPLSRHLRSLSGPVNGPYLSRPTARMNGTGTVPCATTPHAAYGEARPPVAATAQYDAPSSIKPLYANLGVLTGPGSTVDPETCATAPMLRADNVADRGRQPHYGNARSSGTVPFPMRNTNTENPNPLNVYNANAVPVHAASVAAVSALTNVHSKTGARASTAACAGAGGTNGNESVITTQTTASSDHPHDARDTGYLCLVMEYHPMGDLCRYALRTKHHLEMRHHRQRQSLSQTLARSGAMSAPLSPRQSELTHGRTAAASSLLTTAAAATWTAKVAISRTDLHPALAAGVGSGGYTSGFDAAGGLDAQTMPVVAVDPTSDNPLTEAQLLSIAYQLASVLGHMHRQNPPIIHRDLKPENILIKGELSNYLDLPRSEALANITGVPSSSLSPAHTTTAGASSRHGGGGRSTARSSGGNNGVSGKSSVSTQSPSSMTLEAVSAAALRFSPSLPPIRITRAVVPIVLIDFGLSIQQDSRGCSHGGRGGGTRPYIAPESWEGGTCTASDVWSLGCVLYALATCRLTAKNVRIMSEEAKQDGFASRMLNDIIAKKYSLAFASFVVSLLVVDPAKRPTAAQAAQCFCVADGEVRFDLRSPFFSNVLDL